MPAPVCRMKSGVAACDIETPAARTAAANKSDFIGRFPTDDRAIISTIAPRSDRFAIHRLRLREMDRRGRADAERAVHFDGPAESVRQSPHQTQAHAIAAARAVAAAKIRLERLPQIALRSCRCRCPARARNRRRSRRRLCPPRCIDTRCGSGCRSSRRTLSAARAAGMSRSRPSPVRRACLRAAAARARFPRAPLRSR